MFKTLCILIILNINIKVKVFLVHIDIITTSIYTIIILFTMFTSIIFVGVQSFNFLITFPFKAIKYAIYLLDKSFLKMAQFSYINTMLSFHTMCDSLVYGRKALSCSNLFISKNRVHHLNLLEFY